MQIFKNELLIAELPDQSGEYTVDDNTMSIDLSRINPANLVQTVIINSAQFGNSPRSIDVSPRGRGQQQLSPEDFLTVHLGFPIRFAKVEIQGNERKVVSLAHDYWQDTH